MITAVEQEEWTYLELLWGGGDDGRSVASGWWRGTCPMWEMVVQWLSWLC